MHFCCVIWRPSRSLDCPSIYWTLVHPSSASPSNLPSVRRMGTLLFFWRFQFFDWLTSTVSSSFNYCTAPAPAYPTAVTVFSALLFLMFCCFCFNAFNLKLVLQTCKIVFFSKLLSNKAKYTAVQSRMVGQQHLCIYLQFKNITDRPPDRPTDTVRCWVACPRLKT